MSKYEQELILKFCENLCDMEATVNNVERAIRGLLKWPIILNSSRDLKIINNSLETASESVKDILLLWKLMEMALIQLRSSLDQIWICYSLNDGESHMPRLSHMTDMTD